MVRKLKQLVQEGGDSKLAAGIRESASQIWLAGVGAFATAQKEGTKIFDSLVEEGESIQAQAKKAAQDTFSEVKARATKSWDDLSWSQLERVFEDRVARALHSLSVPSRKDLDTLSHRVAELTAVTKSLAETLEGTKRARPTRRPSANKRT